MQSNDTAHHDRIATLCPFCNKTKVRVELMEGVNMFNDDVKIGFFTCTSCGQDWSHRISM
ncbi:MAG: hypothetical protein C0392_03160 [Syntrophus sp. (in: bacteria)]|nr:hypothetical protein [Syntrophus sp. (in: bacteria)]